MTPKYIYNESEQSYMLSEALKLVRIFHRLNQSELAKKLEISRSYLSEIESGKKTASLELLNKYSNIFNIPPSSILMFSEKIETDSIAEKSRVVVAGKILKIMSWLSETRTLEYECTSSEPFGQIRL